MNRRWILPIGLAIGAALIGGLWAGLGRLGLPVGSAPILLHGPLMVLGFLGTAIGVERAVAMRRLWPWAAPGLSAIGVVLLLLGYRQPGFLLIAASGVILVLVYLAALRISGVEVHLIVMGLGALSWIAAASGLAAARPMPAIVPALAGFLVLTICGERLELSRMAQPRSPWWRWIMLAAAASFSLTGWLALPGGTTVIRVAGASMILLAVTAARGDVAWRTVRTSGLTRFMGAAMLAGYFWLAVTGVLWTTGGLGYGTLWYDAAVHAVFLGFVISMVFAHAAVIVPAVAGITVPYRRSWWVALGLLHLSLTVRVVGDLFGSDDLHTVGGIFNVVALLLFIALAAASVVRDRRSTAVTA